MKDLMLYKIDGCHYRAVTWEDLPKCETCEYRVDSPVGHGAIMQRCGNADQTTVTTIWSDDFGCNRHSDYYKR